MNCDFYWVFLQEQQSLLWDSRIYPHKLFPY